MWGCFTCGFVNSFASKAELIRLGNRETELKERIMSKYNGPILFWLLLSIFHCIPSSSKSGRPESYSMKYEIHIQL